MTDSRPHRGVIPARTVRRLKPAVLVDSGSAIDEQDRSGLTIVPLVDGDLVAGLEIKCRCGASALVECVYDAEKPS